MIDTRILSLFVGFKRNVTSVGHNSKVSGALPENSQLCSVMNFIEQNFAHLFQRIGFKVELFQVSMN